MKNKIYQTIKGLIILFIKLQFSIKCNQDFKLLRTSNSNIYLSFYLNLSFNPNGLITCIILNAFVLSLICLMILDMHLQKSLHPIKLSLYLRTCQTWGPLVYSLKGFCHSRQYLDVVIEDKTDVRTREMS